MRLPALLATLGTLGGILAPSAGQCSASAAVVLPAGAAKPAAKPGAKTEEQSEFAIYVGRAPWGPEQAIFLTGERWVPRAFDLAQQEVQTGAQGMLTWLAETADRPYRQALRFVPAEVPLVLEHLSESESGEPAVLRDRSRQGAALLLRALAPGDQRALVLLKRWYRQKELTRGEWFWVLRAAGYTKLLQASAKSDPEAAYEHLTRLFDEGRFAEARAFAQSRAARIDAIAAARHDEADRSCAPIRRRDAGIEPTNMSWARLLAIAAHYAQGQKKGGAGPSQEAQKALKAFKRRNPRFAESALLCPVESARPPAHELLKPDAPRVLLHQVKGFTDVLRR